MASPYGTLRSALAAIRDPHTAPSAPTPGSGAPMSLSFSGGLGGGSAFGEVGMAQQLQDVAKQLSFQMEYNTDLLAQLQRLEEEHLVFQKGAADKQAALRQALSLLLLQSQTRLQPLPPQRLQVEPSRCPQRQAGGSATTRSR